jgi:N-acetylneuraminate synthase
LPEEFSDMVVGIRQVEAALGSGVSRTISQGEMINKENLGKSLVAARRIRSGTKIEREDILVKSPGQGLSPLLMDKLIGKTIDREMDFEDFFYHTDIENSVGVGRDFSFKRPWGIPVRYHDFQKFNSLITPDIWEFHLSYTDMDLDLRDFLQGTYDQGFVVHAPELFKGSHLMDLASMDERYRAISIEQTQKVINLTLKLGEFFPNTKKPLIVANVGGFSLDAPLVSDEVLARYQILRKSLTELKLDGVELIPQTMAPFPWHFGGQRYQNLFLSASEIIKYSNELGLRVCLDISHSKLACNHFGWDFEEFLESVIPYTAHIHVGDAKGVNGEGLQVFDGEIDFHKFGKILDDASSLPSFIPEIWQGHKNNGQTFWVALQRLQGIL